MSKNRLKLVCIDDHILFTRGLHVLLEKKKEELEIIKSLENGKTAIEWLQNNPNEADIILMDINMPLVSGLEVVRYIKKHDLKPKAIIISMYDDIGLANQILQEGAWGYLTKSVNEMELFDAITSVISGNIYICEEIKSKQENSKMDKLTLSTREIEVLRLLINGLTTKQIANALFISSHTVESHRKNLLKKTATKNTPELIHYVASKNIIEINTSIS